MNKIKCVSVRHFFLSLSMHYEYSASHSVSRNENCKRFYFWYRQNVVVEEKTTKFMFSTDFISFTMLLLLMFD